MLYAGLDLSRQRLDVRLLDEEGQTVTVTAVRPDADAAPDASWPRPPLRPGGHGGDRVDDRVRFVHDTLELYGWEVASADATKVKGIAPLAAETDKIDARVLAELARRALVPEIWLPTPEVRAERQRARFRLHLVHHRTGF